MARKFLLVLLALGLLAAPALAQGSTRRLAMLHPAEEIPAVPLLLIVPCIVLDATAPDPAGEPRRVQGTHPPICTFPIVRVNLTASGTGGVGELVLNLRAPGLGLGAAGGLLDKHPPRDLSMQTQASQVRPVATLLPPTPSVEGAEEELERTRTVTVAFQASWELAHCRAPTGHARAEVDGSAVPVVLPAEAYVSLCRLAQDPSAGLLPAATFASHALGAAAATDRGVARDLAAVRAGLETLTLEPPAALADAADLEAASLSTLTLQPFALPNVRSETGACAAGACVEVALGEAEERAAAPGGAVEVAERPPADRQRPPASPPPGAGPAAAAPPAEPAPGLPPGPAPGSDAGGPLAPLTAQAAARAPSDRSAPGLVLAGAAALSLLALLGLALYQRLARPRALDHPARAALFAAVGTQARTSGEAADATGLARKTAEYHLVYLVRLGLLSEVRGEGGVRRFAQPTVRTEPVPERLADRVLASLHRAPGSHASGLAAALGVTRARLDRCVKDLLVAGRLESRLEQGARRLYVVVGRPPNG